jgi:hypothetical protein
VRKLYLLDTIHKTQLQSGFWRSSGSALPMKKFISPPGRCIRRTCSRDPLPPSILMPEPRFRSCPGTSLPPQPNSLRMNLILRSTDYFGHFGQLIRVDSMCFKDHTLSHASSQGPILRCLTLILLRKWNESERLRAVVDRAGSWWPRTALCWPANGRLA